MENLNFRIENYLIKTDKTIKVPNKVENKRNLFIITSFYPYGPWEPYIETELKILKQYFSKIIIITNEEKSKIKQPIPNSIKIHRNAFKLNFYHRICSLKFIFTRIFISEILLIRNLYKQKIKLNNIRTLLVSMKTGELVSDFLENLVEKYEIPKESLVMYSFWNNNMSYGISCLKKKLKKSIAISRAHRWDIFFEGNKGNYLPLRKEIQNNLDSIYFSSEEGKEYYSKKLKSNSKKLKVSYLGIKSSNFKNIGIKNFPLKILTCSQIIERKRINILINALSQLDLNIQWTHIGDGNKKNEIESLSNEILSDKVNIDYKFLGQYPNEELYNYYKTEPIDIFVNLSDSEGIPMVIIEVMSFGTPVIATNVGGISEIVNNKNGILLKQDPDVEEVKNAIAEMANTSNERFSELRENAFKTWGNKFDAEKTYNKFAIDLLNL